MTDERRHARPVTAQGPTSDDEDEALASAGHPLAISRRGALALGAVWGAQACDRGDRASRGLSMLIQSEPAHLDPRFPTDAVSAMLSRLVFDSLLDLDPSTLEFVPSLARRVESVSPTRLRVSLRTDARFHDGAPVTAEDVEATYRALLDPRIGSPVRSMLAQILAGARTVDRSTVELDLREPTGIASLALAQPILRARDAGRTEIPAEPGNERAFVGSGPLRVSALARNAWTFDRISAPRDGRASRLTFLTVKDANTMALRLLHGRADVAEVKPELFPVFFDRPGFTVARARGVACAYLPLRNDHPRLRVREVRHAIAHAIDRAAIVRGKFRGCAVEATGLLPPTHWAHHGDVPRYSHDPARARALLDAAWPAADGSRESLVFRCSNQRFALSAAAAIAEMLRAVGLTVDLRPSELSVLLADLRSGRYDLALLQAPDVSEPHILWTLFASDARPTPTAPRAGLNRWRFSNPTFDRAVDAARRSAERSERRAHYALAQRILAQELPVVPLWHPDVVFVGAPRTTGLLARGDSRFEPLMDVRLG
jgi:peptide/nickel transport system substrate-binding protein